MSSLVDLQHGECDAPDCTNRITGKSRRWCSEKCRTRTGSRRRRGRYVDPDLYPPTVAVDEPSGRGDVYDKIVALNLDEALLAPGADIQAIAKLVGVSDSAVYDARATLAVAHDQSNYAWKITDTNYQLLGLHLEPPAVLGDNDETWEYVRALAQCFKSYRHKFMRYPTPAGGEAHFITKPFHEKWITEILYAMVTGSRLEIMSPPRHGKQVDDDCPVKTRRGWVRHGDLVAGDEVVGSDGGWTKVRAITGSYVNDAYDLTFSDGSHVVVSGEHEWQAEQRYGHPPVIRETSQFAGDIFEADGRRKWRIPIAGPTEGADSLLPLDPYLLGCWLGDGTTMRGEITTADDGILNAFEVGGFATSYEYRRGAAATYGLPGLVTVLRFLDLIGNKHIPDLYHQASVADRLALLQGLMDTDGWAARNGSQQAYSTTDPRLAADFKELVCSLGGVYTQRVRQVAGRPGRESAWEIYPRLPDGMVAFRLARKVDRMTTRTPRNLPRRFVASVEEVGPRSMQCIEVDAADGLYCVGRDMIVTHNSELLQHFCAWLIKRNPNIRILWVGPNSDVAEFYLGGVRTILESAAMVKAFLAPGVTFRPQARSAQTWSQTKFTVATRTTDSPSPTMAALGPKGRILSRTLDLIILDDIEDQTTVSEPGTREKTRRFMTVTMESRKMVHTGMVVIGSRQHHDDVYGYLLDDPTWRHIVDQAHDDECVIPELDVDLHVECMMFPEINPYSWLLEKRRGADALNLRHVYEMVYLNRTRPEGFIVFAEAPIVASYDFSRGLGLNYIDGTALPITHKFGGLDPSVSGYQAAFMWGYRKAGTYDNELRPERLWMMDLENHLGGGTKAALVQIVMWNENYDLKHWVVETNLYHGGIINDRDIQLYCQANSIYLEAHQTHVNKWDDNFGVSTLAKMFDDGVISLPVGSPEAREKSLLYKAQCLGFSPEATKSKAKRGYKSDVLMSSWFPMKVVRRLRAETVAEMSTDYTPFFDDFPMIDADDVIFT